MELNPAPGFLKLWTCSVIGIFGFGVALVLFVVAMMFLNPQAPMRLNGKPTDRATMLLFSGGFLAVWLVVGFVFLWVGRHARAVASGQARPARLNRNPRIECTFEFRPPGGEVVRAQDTVTFHEGLGDSPTEPVLYDPESPGKALLFHGLTPTVRVSDFGEWLAPEGFGPWVRLALVAACVAGGPYLGWVIWNAL